MASYSIPAFGSPASTVHGWLLEAADEGAAWLRTQRPATEWQRVLDALAPSDQTQKISNLSGCGYNKTKRIARELVASLGNFHYDGSFKVEYDQNLYETAEHLTKRDRIWFRQARINRAFRQLLQYGVAFGTAYAYQTWDKHFWGPYRGDIRLTALSPEDVTFVQLPRDHDVQQAYVVLIREELPINLARRRFYPENPAFANALNPDRDAPGWVEKGLRKVQALIGGSPIFKYTGRDRNKDTASFPTVDIFHAYIADDSINTGPVPRTMGDPDCNWSYTVPVYGSDIPTGKRDDNGSMIMRRAREEDCRLFPLRRYCIFSRSVDFPCVDTTSPWWHGQVPIARFRFGDWAWEPLGSSLIADVLTMQEGIEGIMRDVEDSSRARMDPPSVYDDTKVSKAWAEAVNPRRAGIRVAADINFGEIYKILGQQWQYEVPTWIPEWIRAQEARMDYLAATPDLVAIAKAKQVPSEGTLEKLMEMAGPLVQDMIRGVEDPQYELGEMRKALYLQFDTRSRWMQLTGPDGSEDFYFEPDKIVPAGPIGETLEARRDRLKLHLNQFHYHLSQSGVNEIHRLATKLFYLQLMKIGFPLDPWSFARIAQIPAFGKEPEGPDGKPITTVLEKWVAWQHIKRELAEELGDGAGAGSGQQRQPGRPQVNRREGRIQQKDGGTRSTIVTS